MDRKGTSLTKIASQKFKKNFWGVFSLVFLLGCCILAIFAYALAPDHTKNANSIILSIHSKPPGFTTSILSIPTHTPIQESKWSQFFWGKTPTEQKIAIKKYSLTETGIAVEEYTDSNQPGRVVNYDLALFPQAQQVSEIPQKYIRETTFLLGTDKHGRDLLSRMLIGARISLSIGFIAVFISLLIGITLGAMAGYFGGKIDTLIMWLINVTWSIPTLLLVIAVTLALGKGFWQVFIAVGLTMWVEVARVVRGQVLSVKKSQYIVAARALGYQDFRIITKHILPNVMAPVIVISAANFASAILIESGLSFLGIGAQSPVPSWGGIIKDHYHYLILGKPYLALIPGLAIMSLVMAFMLMGNALRDALDVKH